MIFKMITKYCISHYLILGSEIELTYQNPVDIKEIVLLRVSAEFGHYSLLNHISGKVIISRLSLSMWPGESTICFIYLHPSAVKYKLLAPNHNHRKKQPLQLQGWEIMFYKAPEELETQVCCLQRVTGINKEKNSRKSGKMHLGEALTSCTRLLCTLHWC